LSGAKLRLHAALRPHILLIPPFAKSAKDGAPQLYWSIEIWFGANFWFDTDDHEFWAEQEFDEKCWC
jgi:hypothetical protein